MESQSIEWEMLKHLQLKLSVKGLAFSSGGQGSPKVFGVYNCSSNMHRFEEMKATLSLVILEIS